MSILVLHVVSTWFMVGLIWTIQTVHYPLFSFVGESSFEEFEDGHTTRMGLLLAAPASLEVLTGGLLVWFRPEQLSLGLVLLGGAILAALWLVTLLIHVPLHRSLSMGWSEEGISRLVSSNWVRTTGWTLRGLLILFMVGQVI